jgi:hypothetical protein
MSNGRSPAKNLHKKNRNVETCPSFRSGHLPSADDVDRLRTLASPHVESFNYFLTKGLAAGIADIEPVEIDIVDPAKPTTEVDWDSVTVVKFWVESAKLGMPVKPTNSGLSTKLLPRECRELGLPYTAPLLATVCYTVIHRRNGVEMAGKPIKVQKNFGEMPILVMSKACHLCGLKPKSLVKLKEEVGFSLAVGYVDDSVCYNAMSLTNMYRLFVAVRCVSKMSLEAILLLVVLNDVCVCYKFLDGTTRLPFNDRIIKTEATRTPIWVLRCGALARTVISPLLPLHFIT